MTVLKETEWLVHFIVQEMPFNQKIRLLKRMHNMEQAFGNAGADRGFPGRKALATLKESFNVDSFLDYHPKTLLGRLANGAQADQGEIVHAVPNDPIHGQTAYCGAKRSGRRSVGWGAPHGESSVNCKRCLSCIEALQKLKGEVA